jgi:hypothetical protein
VERGYPWRVLGRRHLVWVFLAALTLLAVPASAAAMRIAPGRTDPKAALVLAERVLQHSPGWSPDSIYCLRPTRSAYHSTSLAKATQRTYRCEWVKQNNSRPWEIDTIHVVSGSSGRYLFSLVSAFYAPPLPRAALCSVQPAADGYRTRCHPTK